jgi:purine nucleosidase
MPPWRPGRRRRHRRRGRGDGCDGASRPGHYPAPYRIEVDVAEEDQRGHGMMESLLVHLDTDLGSDVDDLAALVMLLGCADVKVSGITTCIDPGGRRAGYVRHVLRLASREDVPVAAGAEVSLTTLAMPGGFPDDERRWPERVPPAPSPAGSALRLLADSVEAGATVIAIGPYTNLALLAAERPGILAGANVVVMGGWFDLSEQGLPPVGPERDWNVQSDTTAARMVVPHAGELTMVPLPLTFRVHVRRAHLERLRAAGSLGRLLAFQAENHGIDESNAEWAGRYAALPDDLLSFQHDPLAGAAALGWAVLTLEERRLAPVLDGRGVLRFADEDGGRPVRVDVHHARGASGHSGPGRRRAAPGRRWRRNHHPGRCRCRRRRVLRCLAHRRGNRGPRWR